MANRDSIMGFSGPAVDRVLERSRKAGAQRVRERMQEVCDLNRQIKMLKTQLKGAKLQLQEEARRVGGVLILDDDMLICLDGQPVQLDLRAANGGDDDDPEDSE